MNEIWEGVLTLPAESSQQTGVLVTDSLFVEPLAILVIQVQVVDDLVLGGDALSLYLLLDS